jgi:PiT family inorganic phosphate transporter
MTSLSRPDVLGTPSVSSKPDLNSPMSVQAILIFLAILALALFFTAFSIYRDISTSGTQVTTILPFLLLALSRC